MTRAERLNQRFRTLQQTLTELHGKEKSFGAASAAWLMAIQYMHRQALNKVAAGSSDAGYGGEPENPKLLDGLEGEMEAVLQSFHAELCEHLGLDQEESWRLARAFSEVIHDICHQGG